MELPALHALDASIPTYRVEREATQIQLVKLLLKKVDWDFTEFANFTLGQYILRRLTDLASHSSPKQSKSYLIAIKSLFKKKEIKDLRMQQCFKCLPAEQGSHTEMQVIFSICKAWQIDKTLQQMATYDSGEMQIAQPLTLQDLPKLIDIHVQSFNTFQTFFEKYFLNDLKQLIHTTLVYRCSLDKINTKTKRKKCQSDRTKITDWTEKEFCKVDADKTVYAFLREAAYLVKIFDNKQQGLIEILSQLELASQSGNTENYIALVNRLALFFQRYNSQFLRIKLDRIYKRLYQLKFVAPFPPSLLYEGSDEEIRKKTLQSEERVFRRMLISLQADVQSIEGHDVEEHEKEGVISEIVAEKMEERELESQKQLEKLRRKTKNADYRQMQMHFKTINIVYNRLIKKLIVCQDLGLSLTQAYSNDYERVKVTSNILNHSEKEIFYSDYYDIQAYRKNPSHKTSAAFVLAEEAEEPELVEGEGIEPLEETISVALNRSDSLNQEICKLIQGVKPELSELSIFSKIGAIQSQLVQQIPLTKPQQWSTLDYYIQMRFKTSLKEAGDHFFLAACGVELLFQTLAKANFADIQTIYLSILMDLACQAEQIACPFYIQSHCDLPPSHHLIHLYQGTDLWQDLPLHLKDYLKEIGNGLLLSRYPIQIRTDSSSSQALDWISFWEGMNQKQSSELTITPEFTKKLQDFLEYINKQQQLARELFLFVAQQKNMPDTEASLLLEGELQALYSNFNDLIISAANASSKKQPVNPIFKLNQALIRCNSLTESIKNTQTIYYLQEAQGHIHRLITSCRMNASINDKHLQPWFARNTLMGAQLIYELLYKSHCSLYPENIGLFEHLHSFHALQRLIEQKTKELPQELNVSFGVHYPHLKLHLDQTRIIKRFVMWVEKSKDFWSDTKVTLIQKDFEVFLEQMIEGINPRLLAIEKDSQRKEEELVL